MSTFIQFGLNDKLYLRDPNQTELGKKIIEESIHLIDELGFESFTFKKLAVAIASTEASVYRYFENKQRLLIYLISWYWVWFDYRISFQTNNIKSAKERLQIVLRMLACGETDSNGSALDMQALQRIVIVESSKAYLTKEVDKANQQGLYREYKKLCKRIAEMILDINPFYPYAHTLVSTLIEASHDQVFFSQHLPSLTDVRAEEANYQQQLEDYLNHLLFSAIHPK